MYFHGFRLPEVEPQMWDLFSLFWFSISCTLSRVEDSMVGLHLSFKFSIFRTFSKVEIPNVGMFFVSLNLREPSKVENSIVGFVLSTKFSVVAIIPNFQIPKVWLFLCTPSSFLRLSTSVAILVQVLVKQIASLDWSVLSHSRPLLAQLLLMSFNRLQQPLLTHPISASKSFLTLIDEWWTNKILSFQKFINFYDFILL